MSDEEGRGLESVLGWNAVKVARIIGSQITAGMAEHDVSLVQFGVLSCLADGAELTSAEIARAVFVRPQSMADVLDGMERRGLVHRVGVRVRGRRNPAAITPAGQAVLDAVQQVALATNDLSSLGLDASRSAQLNELLIAVIEGAEAELDVGDGPS
ncbi:MarR family winged helix-turn-helix transcriptional regulator [Frigoribacterium sp. VKM Ac-2836]|uniref:MarR family winged helix-turn-helix transcriptional regulator n=1 Tax=Frigoribacterium sp. VKM Ac-2836 TaxID=2739014 RepID=UPI0015679649|nr:MarR family winged helix-turn-helix transcriptional regulator [Frigoribacterium sp. VKM Ac-2836]NRD27971.1 winged helix-turn-helix transcriptional regulator [Frigoribacterium sp. VKM Ac-2836]